MGKNTAKIKAPTRVAHKPAAIFIDHPGTDPVHTTIAAFGTADRVGQIIGLITDSSGSVVAIGRTLAEPPCWTIFFRDLPGGAALTLWVFEVPEHGRPSAPFFEKQDFNTVALSPFDPINITYPTSGSTVPKAFSAYGNTTVNGAVMGDVDGQVTQPGIVLCGPPDWVVKFGGLPAGYPYILGIRVGMQGAQPVTGLTVQ